LVPQILGHTVLNWALPNVEASIISGAILAEPVVSALLAWLVLSEKPGLATFLVHMQSRFRVMSYSSRHEASNFCT
jgi:drug/metabolite transporter (DMT)-like permease